MFWRVIPYSLIGVYQRFGGTCFFHLQRTKSLFYHEDGGRMFLLNAGNYQPDYTLSHFRRSLFAIRTCEKNFSAFSLLIWFL
jgi:hypothetical protein